MRMMTSHLVTGLPDVSLCPAVLPVLDEAEPGELQPVGQEGRDQVQALGPLLPPPAGVLLLPHQLGHAVVHGPGDGHLLCPLDQHQEDEQSWE